MSFNLATLLFSFAVSAHNFEEALFLPEWSQRAGRWRVAVGVAEFRFAVIVLTIAAWLCAAAALVGGRESVGAYLVCGYALAMLLNVFAPHLAATLALRAYMPGTATGVLLNLPACANLLVMAFRENYVATQPFAYVGIAVVVALVGSVPLLFALGRRFFPSCGASQLPWAKD